NSYARTTDTNIDAVWQGLQACRITGFTEPDSIIMHPTNFTPIRLYKDANGNYSFDVTVQNGVPMLFGQPGILSVAMTLNTARVGNFGILSHMSRRMGLNVTVGYQNDDFVKNQKTILAEFRESLEIYRAAAFTKITNLQ